MSLISKVTHEYAGNVALEDLETVKFATLVWSGIFPIATTLVVVME